MDTLLGLIGLVVFSVCIVVLAAGMTWIVVKISPVRDAKRTNDSPN